MTSVLRDAPRPDVGRAQTPVFRAEDIRRDFPILERRIHGRPLVYLDNAASAQKPRSVIGAMSRAMEESYANVHRGLHTLSNEATDAFEAARSAVATFIGAAPNEVVFTKGATEAINLVASGLGLEINPGDEILLTEMEHHANIVPWHFLRERRGAVLKFAPVSDDGVLDLAALRGALTPRTKILALTQMSNVTGVRVDVAAAAAAAHAFGAKVLVDGAQAVVHETIDVAALGCDFYVFSGHKLYGPTGIGVLWGRREALEALPPYQGGGEMISSVSLEAITYADPPHRFEAGTPPIVEAIGLGAAVDWLSSVDRAAGALHEHALHDHARDRLRGENWIRILGDVPDKGAILSFTVNGAHAHDVAQILDRYGVAVRAGSHCAEPLMRRFGVGSSVRASFALYNTLEECDAFVDALVKAHSFFD